MNIILLHHLHLQIYIMCSVCKQDLFVSAMRFTRAQVYIYQVPSNVPL